MSSCTVPAKLTLRPDSIPSDVCAALVSEINSLGPEYWVHRKELHPTRAVSSFTACSYYSCLNQAIPLHIAKILQEFNPCPERTMMELIINKYEDGDWIPTHRDRHQYKSFALVPLQTSKVNGTIVEQQMIFDEVGRAGIFEGVRHNHSVPPVIGTRYTVLYLYE